VVADMIPDDLGVWMFHCHVTDHLNDGMTALYRVLPMSTPLPAPFSAQGPR
jgi:FtsP/CotA-like multicopper oxidase with cupredoxin domain